MHIKRGRCSRDDKRQYLQFFNISSFSCRIVFAFLFSFCLLSTANSKPVSVKVDVTGVGGALKENVLAYLTLYQQKDNVRLKESTVKRLHDKAADDIASALAPFGYYNSKVDPVLTKDEQGFHAKYVIEKGPPVLVDLVNVSVEGSGKDNRGIKKVIAQWALSTGKILDQAVYELSLIHI